MTDTPPYDFDDIFLIPSYSELDSRALADTSTTLLNPPYWWQQSDDVTEPRRFKLPVTPSNMKCCISQPLAKQLSKDGYFYVMHRFGIDLYDFVRTANQDSWPFISVSIGVSTEELAKVELLRTEKLRIDCLTIDIAHGHCKAMAALLPKLKALLPTTILIAGNVATKEGVEALSDWGASVVKVGIGGGSVCSTKLKTGFTYPMFSCVQECAKNRYDTPIIADGGISHNGDIAKALVAGASMAMAGNMFVSCKDSPAKTIYPGPMNQDLTGYSKLYFGSASAQNKGKHKHVEGFQRRIRGNGLTYKQKMIELEEDISSAISYAGGKDLSIFKSTAYGTRR